MTEMKKVASGRLVIATAGMKPLEEVRATTHSNHHSTMKQNQPSSHRHSARLIATGAALLVTVTGVFLGSRATAPSAGGLAAGPVARVSVVAAEQANAWQWPLGGTASYRVEQTVDVTPKDLVLAPSAPGRTSVEGFLHVRVTAVSPERITLAARLSGVSLTSTPPGAEKGARSPVVEEMLNTTPAVLHLSPQGQVIACLIPADLPDEDRGMIQGLIAPQFVLKAGQAWKTTETDQCGTYDCQYRALAVGQWSKVRSALPAAPAATDEVHSVTARSHITAGAGALWFEKFQGTESLDCLLQDRVLCSVETSFSYERAADSALPEGFDTFAASQAAQAVLVSSQDLAAVDCPRREPARSRQQQAWLEQKYAAIPCSQMIGAIESVVAAGGDHATTIPAMHALRDWILSRPGAAGEVAASLKGSALPDAVTARIVHALELAGRTKPEGQAGLAAILTAPAGTYPPVVSLQAAVAAGGVGQLRSDALVPALQTAMGSENVDENFLVNDSALYALGSLAAGNPELRPGLLETLRPRLTLDSQTSPGDVATALRALGNAKIDDAEIMQQALNLGSQHNAAEVREAAVDYFSATHTSEALAGLSRALNDPAESVRKGALQALTSPELASPETLSPVLALAGDATAPLALRELAVDALAPHQAVHPEIRQQFLALLPGAQGDLAARLQHATGSPL